jgi:RHS repeat-associated protein
MTACAYDNTSHVHAVTQCGNETFAYDQVGNMTERRATSTNQITSTYAWDAQNRLKSATVGGVPTLFGYDGDGGRVTKTTQNTTTVYVGELYECTSAGCARYIFAGSQRIAMKPVGGGTLYYHTDHLGSSTVVTGESGNIEQAIVYEPYGRTRASYGPTDVHHKFTGQELDDSTGLYHYNARYYDPALGRFLSADTIVPDPANPQSLNRYAYARNNPLVYSDPSGHCEIVCITVIVLISATANAIQAGMNSGWDMQAMLTGAVIGAVSGVVGGAAGAGVSSFVGGGLGGAILGGAAGGLVGSTTSAVLYSAAGYDVNIGMAALAGLGGGAVGGLGGFIGGPALAAIAGGAAGTAISGGDFGAGFVIGVAAAMVTAAIVSQSSSDTAAAPSPEEVSVAEAEASTVDLGPKGTPGGELIQTSDQTSGSPLRVAARDQSQGIDGDPIPKECIKCHAQGLPGERGPRSPGAGIQDHRPDYNPKDPYNDRGCDTCAPGVPAPPKVLPDGTIIIGGQQHL